MSVQVKIIYGRDYDRCKTSSISSNSLKDLDLAMLSEIVWDTVGSYYRDGRDPKSLRIQYRDDEGTFVTITGENDVQDAVRSCKSVLQGDYETVRLCLRVDDAWTPLGMKETKPLEKPQEKRPAVSRDARKRLFEHDQKEQTMYSSDSSDEAQSVVAETPFQRYVKKVKDRIAAKRSELYKLESNEQEVQRKILRVKSNPTEGNLCRNCHMRLGHTARHCDYEKCLSIFACGEEKLHPGEIDSRGARNSIKKVKDEIAKLEKDLSLKEEQANKLSESLSNKIEKALMKESGNQYIDGGIKKWALLRKHVYILEKHCKEHFEGRIPAKHKLSDILEVALEREDVSGDEYNANSSMSQVKTKRTRALKRTNPAKALLQEKGISFPNPSDQATSSSHSSSVHRCAPSNVQEEAEQLNMVLKQSLLDSSVQQESLVQQEQRSLFTTVANACPEPIPTPYQLNNTAPSYTFQDFPNYSYGNMNPYFYPYTPTVQQPVFHPSDSCRVIYASSDPAISSGNTGTAASLSETTAAPNTISRPSASEVLTSTESETRDAALHLMFLSSGNDKCLK